MIYITGDTHGDFRRFEQSIFPEQKSMTKEDYVIIAGDFGGVWYQRGDAKHQPKEATALDELESRSFTTLFVPGNHENYARLFSDEFPVKEWHGGLVKEIRPSVLMLMRGEMFEIDGAKFFAFGGAKSHDVIDGILDINDPELMIKVQDLKRQGKKYYRIRGLSWWPEELPSEQEMAHGIETLEKNDWETDFVITHGAPASLQALLGFKNPDRLTTYLEDIRSRLTYKRWFFGHYHTNAQLNPKDAILYEQIIRIR